MLEPPKSTGTTLTASTTGRRCESDRLVAFGDGIETDRIDLTWGQTAKVRLARVGLALV